MRDLILQIRGMDIVFSLGMQVGSILICHGYAIWHQKRMFSLMIIWFAVRDMRAMMNLNWYINVLWIYYEALVKRWNKVW